VGEKIPSEVGAAEQERVCGVGGGDKALISLSAVSFEPGRARCAPAALVGRLLLLWWDTVMVVVVVVVA